MKKKILLIEGVHPKAQELFKNSGFDVKVQQSSSTEADLLNADSAISLGIRSRTQIGPSFLSQSKELLCVGAFCIGTDQINLEAASKNGVAIFNSPYSNTRSVAELVISHIVSLSRQIMYFNQLAHRGEWKKTSTNSYEVRGKTIGIIGYGHIGSQVSILSEAMGLNVLYYDIEKKLSLGNSKPVGSLKELLSVADFITLHVPNTPETKNMITKKELQLMKSGSYLINTSRGSTIQLDDLYQSLKDKHLFGAAIDVFPEEPSNNQEVFKINLQEFENVILTPHIGGSTEEAQVGIAQDVSERLIDYILLGDSSGSVNFPNLRPAPLRSSTIRISNVHTNKPGTLTKINNIISSLKLNIVAQNLSTTHEIGYLITDIELQDGDKKELLVEEIQKLETSIKTRVIPGK